ncbi:UNVERIFIED_CONTAM: Aluminum-activated malate transporter 9 [Sesamum latifolium]|uniref:Aluminum-activated malate transporter 9 n=1 Tax=Sesamum latifolium TaxID=2727402 RepID=A0AAW2SPC7_9LAMI
MSSSQICSSIISINVVKCATFNRGFTRAIGSLLAGVIAVAVAELALRTGRVAEPIIIGFSIFIVGAVTSFMKLWPSLVPYEYGFQSIAIGGIVVVVVNVLVFPIWAGEQLHKEFVSSFASVADAPTKIEKYIEDDGSDHPELTKTVMDDFPDEPAYKKCRSTLNSSAKLESLANSAQWEPPHGRFQHFFYPWSEYVKVGVVLRYCAYEVMAIHGVLHSEIQALYNLRVAFQKEIQDAATEAAELVRCLGKDICNMRRSLKTLLLKRVHSSTERLQHAIDVHSYLLTSEPQWTLSHALSSAFSNLSNHMTELDLAQNSDPQSQPLDSYHETMKKQSRRLYSWPSREVDAFEEEGCLSSDCIPRMRALETTATLSLATFTSLLIEFVARLGHLVEAVDQLSKMAKFK